MTCECEKRKNYNFYHAFLDACKSLLGKKDVWVSKETQTDRLSICEKCEGKTNIRCSVCGCILALKTKFKLSSCPKGKW